MATQYQKFGDVTPEGKRVIGYLEGLSAATVENDPTLVSVDGATRHYFANVKQLKSMTEAQWLESLTYAADMIHSALLEQDAKQEQQETQESANSETAAKLAKLQEEVGELDDLKAELAALKAELATLTKKKVAPKTDEAVPAPESE